jgi:hypothetical protein
VRPLRLLLSATAAVATLAAATAHAAPPNGCYGLPDDPATLVCVTFTPSNAVPSVDPDGGGVVTVPAFCAGDCYGPIPVTTPSGDFPAGPILVVTHNGQSYVVAVGGGLPPVHVPPVHVPPVNEPPVETGECPGNRPYRPQLEAAEPFVCVTMGDDGTWEANQVLYVGTCATPDCTVIGIPTRQLAEQVTEWIEPVGNIVSNLRDCLTSRQQAICS